MIDAGCTQMSLVNSGVTGPKFIKFTHDALGCKQIIAAINVPIAIATFQSVSECEDDE